MPRFFWVHQELLRLEMVYPGDFRAQKDAAVVYKQVHCFTERE